MRLFVHIKFCTMMDVAENSEERRVHRHTLGSALAYGADRDSLRTLLSSSTDYPRFLRFSQMLHAAENVQFYKRTTLLKNMLNALEKHAGIFFILYARRIC